MDEKVQGHTESVSNDHSPLKKDPSKKYIVIGIAVVFLLVLTAAYYLPKKTPPKVSKTSSNKTMTTAAIPTLPATAPASWHVIKTQVYSVTVPTGWEPSVLPFKGGASLLLQPHNVAMEPLLVVEAFTSPKGTVEDKVKMHEKYNYKRTNISVQKQPAVLLTATRESRAINKKKIKTPTQNRIVYLTQGKTMYSIRMYYSSSVPVQVYDDIFDKVLASFKPKK